MSKKASCLLLILGYLFAAVAINADDTKKNEKSNKGNEKRNVTHEEKVTVVARPIINGTTITRYGDRKEIVSSRQIDDLNAQDLATSLYRVPGVVMSRHNFIGAYGGGDGGAIFIRGHGASRPGQEIGTLIDGIPKFSGIWTHSLIDMLPVDMAGELEIYKSAQPALFGNMSFGVVNIIPKIIKNSGSEGRILTEYGAFNTSILRAEYGAKAGNIDYYILGSHRNSDGHRKNSAGDVDSIYSRFGYDLGGGFNVSLQAHHTSGNVEDPGEDGSPLKPMVERFITQSNLFIAKITHESGWSNGSIRFYLDNGLQDWKQWDSLAEEPFSSVTDYKNYGIRIRENLFFKSGSNIVIGIDYDSYGGTFVEERFSGDRMNADIQFQNMAPYILVSQSFGDESFGVIFSGGFRANFSRYFEDETGYQTGVRVNFADLIFYGNYAHSFNLPGVYSAILFGGGASPDGWKSLKAEQIEHWEIGVSHNVSDFLQYTLSYYDDDVIDGLKVTFPGPQYMNIGNYSTRGIELGINLFPLNDTDVFIGVSYQNTEPEETPYAPDLTIVAGLNCLLTNRLKVGVMVQYVDEHYAGNPRSPRPNTLLEEFTLVNLRLGYNLGGVIRTDWAEIFLAVENLTSTDYQLKPNYSMPGAAALIGIDLKF